MYVKNTRKIKLNIKLIITYLKKKKKLPDSIFFCQEGLEFKSLRTTADNKILNPLLKLTFSYLHGFAYLLLIYYMIL